MTAPISPEESFEHSLRNLLNWLDVMTMDPVELSDTWGNYNVAWELVSDMKKDGGAVLGASCSYLSEPQMHAIRDFLSSLSGIPESVLVGATTVSASHQAMSHPCWVPLRRSASALLQVLASAAAKNRAYFGSQ